MKETSKSYQLRKRNNHFNLYLNGYGIDIGSGDDLLVVENGKVDTWDLPHGDAQYMHSIGDNTYDFVYSSHCLEHMNSVKDALSNWLRILKKGGHLFFTVPEYVLYEKMRFPSIFNTDHKNSFSYFIENNKVGRLNHYFYKDIINMLSSLGANTLYCSIEDENYNYNIGPDADQTLGNALAQLAFCAKKI